VSDEITLTIPRERPFAGIADLVVGGLGARHDLTIDVIDDVQLALEGLLEKEDEGELTLRFRLVDGALETHVGPFDGASLEAELQEDAGVGLARLLSTVMDGYEVSDGPGGRWIGMRKDLAAETVSGG
jgi:hypothetical protein